MKYEADGLPECGPSKRTLGAKEGEEGDIPVDDNGMVKPDTGGMSVSPPPPEHLPDYRRPPKYGGTVKKAKLYEIDTNELPEALKARSDPNNPERHVFIEPAWEMSFEDYEQVLENTRLLWRSL